VGDIENNNTHNNRGRASTRNETAAVQSRTENKRRNANPTRKERKKKPQNPFPLSASTQPKKFHDVIHMVFELYEKGIIVKHQ
jgi:hypothetical protein